MALLPEGRALVAWGAALLAALLLAASLAGDGGGLMGVPALRHPGWSYALVGIAFLAAVAAAHPGRTAE